MRILIADDDRVSTLVLGRALEQWGFDVVVAHDGTAAWERIIGDEPPELAIIDWMMPGLDGIEVCRRIRATPPRAPVYVILLTARTSRQDLVAGLEAGLHTVLVLSEVATREGVDRFPYTPSRIVGSVADLVDELGASE